MTPAQRRDKQVVKDSFTTAYEAAANELHSIEREKERNAHAKGFRPIVIWPDPVLSRVAEPIPPNLIEELNSSNWSQFRDLLNAMAFTMVSLNANGLAAPQIGVSLQIIALRFKKSGSEEFETIHVINPKITELNDAKQTTVEKCLSLPGIEVEKTRAAFARIEGIGSDGARIEVAGEGLIAVAIQHEMDHLNGITIADGCTSLKRSRLRSKLKKKKEAGLRYRLVEPDAQNAEVSK